MASTVTYCECPNCKYNFNTFGTTLFKIFKCGCCGWRFRGIHARIAYSPFFLKINWLQYAAACPNYCSIAGVTELIYIPNLKQGSICNRCECKLPIQPAIQESTDFWDDDNVQSFWKNKKENEYKNNIKLKQQALEALEKQKLKKSVIQVTETIQKPEKKKWSKEIDQQNTLINNKNYLGLANIGKVLEERRLRKEYDSIVIQHKQQKLLKEQQQEQEELRIKQQQEQELELKKKQEQEQQEKFKQLEIDSLVFWEDYQSIPFRIDYLKKLSTEEVLNLKQNLLKHFQLARQEDFMMSLRLVEMKIKGSSFFD